MKQIYLDNASTTHIDPLVLNEMMPYLKNNYGNPSSIHLLGTKAKAAIENARKNIAKLLNAESEEIIFTSGGTESINIAIKGAVFANRNKGNHIISTEIEHSSVIQNMRFLESEGFKVTYIKPDKYGVISPSDIKKSVRADTIFASIMYANNEIGTIEPIKEISNILKEKNIIFHTDAVQAVGHIPTDVEKLGIDLLSLSAHKFYGPKGIGSLYIRKGTKLISFVHGGGQEKRLRPGTENVSGIIGLGKAAELAYNQLYAAVNRTVKLRDYFFKEIKNTMPGIIINGHIKNRLPNNINITIPGIESEVLLMRLSKLGIYASTGSACSSFDQGPSHVLISIGLTKQMAHSTLRFTLGKRTKKSDIEYLIKILRNLMNPVLLNKSR